MGQCGSGLARQQCEHRADDCCVDIIYCYDWAAAEELPGMGLRFRLYGLERMRREQMIGESVVGFASLRLHEPVTHWVTLEPRTNLSVSELTSPRNRRYYRVVNISSHLTP